MWFDETKELLGSHLRVTFEDEQIRGEQLLNSIWEKLQTFQRKYSRFISGNYLEKINNRLGEWQDIDEETYGYIDHVLDLQERFGLNFSLAVKKQLEHLGYDSKYSFEAAPERLGPLAGKVLLQEPNQLFISDPIE